jgi:acyl-CoA thioesterase-1
MQGIVVLGDSLTAGLGLVLEQSYPSRLQDLFMVEGYHEVDIMNAGVSGDTTAGGLRRIGELLHPGVRIVVVALGGNDSLRGLPNDQTRRNLAGIIDACLESGAAVLLAGMEGPTNLGEDYRTNFRNTFQELAAEYRGRGVRFVPFLLEGVAGMSHLNQPDGIHPTAEGANMIAEHLYPTLRDMVDEIPAGPVTQ